MSDDRPPFRADHVGSLLRPPELKAARDRFRTGEITAGQLRAVEDAAIREAVAMQERLGLHGITDGEFRRGSWHMDFLYRLGGVSLRTKLFRLAHASTSVPSAVKCWSLVQPSARDRSYTSAKNSFAASAESTRS